MEEKCLSARRIFFDLLHINPIRVAVSFLTFPHLAKGEAVTERSLKLERLLRRLGLLANIEGLLPLNALVLERAYGPRDDIIGSISEHYRRAAYRQVGRFPFSITDQMISHRTTSGSD